MSTPPTETPMDRARRVADLLLEVGRHWTYRIPPEGAMRGGVVWLDGVAMRPHYIEGIGGVPAWWELTEKTTGQVVVVPAKAERKAS